MLENITTIGPVALAVLFYVIKLERRLSKVTTDICWIKKFLEKCQQLSEEVTK